MRSNTLLLMTTLLLPPLALANPAARIDTSVAYRQSLCQQMAAHQTNPGSEGEAGLHALARHLSNAFQSPAHNPSSKALPALWEQRAAFRQLQQELISALGHQPSEARPAAIHEACNACHARFTRDVSME